MKRAAGKHRCKWIEAGGITQLNDGKKMLKKPKAVVVFYECKVCGEMKTEQVKQ